MDDEGPRALEPQEREDIEADLGDLRAMHECFAPQGVKGVVIACPDCGANHFYEWDLLRDNLQHMLETGEYIQWDYGKGYIDALVDTGLDARPPVEVTACPWCETPSEGHFQFCPRCGRSLAAVRLYAELLDRGMEERDVRALLVKAGFEPF